MIGAVGVESEERISFIFVTGLSSLASILDPSSIEVKRSFPFSAKLFILEKRADLPCFRVVTGPGSLNPCGQASGKGTEGASEGFLFLEKLTTYKIKKK